MVLPTRWFALLQIITLLLVVFLTVVGYNRFILNANLQNLKRSLSILDSATGIGQAEAALLLVDQTLVSEMAREEVNLQSLSVLQYAQGTLSSSDPQRPVEDAQVLVSSLAEETAQARPAFLTTLDTMAAGLQSAINRATLLPRQIAHRPTRERINPEQLQRAMRQEQVGLYPQAAALYEKLLTQYPHSEETAALRMRLGYVYQRDQKFDKSEGLYRQALQEARTPQELWIAQQLLRRLTQMRAAQWTAKTLEEKAASAKSGVDQQKAAFRLGSTLIQLYEMSRAAQAFHEAYAAEPQGKLAPASLFKEGWCLKMAGQPEEALKKFQEIIRLQPKSRWASASYQQMAESYRASGDSEAAAHIYEKLLLSSEDAAFAAAVHAFTGSIYLYDLKQPEKAKFHFDQIQKSFPASPLSSTEQQIQRARTIKGLGAPPAAPAAVRPITDGSPTAASTEPTAVSLEVGTPVMKWLGNFLPIFVDVFADRLSRYMEATNTKQLSRRYSEAEFQELVLSRVQEKFADQVSEVTVKIRPNGFVGSGKIRLGILRFPLEARIGINVVNEIPHAQVYEIKVANLSVSAALCKMLEDQTNAAIDQKQYPIKVKACELKAGYAQITVELKPKSTSSSSVPDAVLSHAYP